MNFHRSQHFFCFCCLLIGFAACEQPNVHVQKGMYYWKSGENHLTYELDTALAHFDVSKFYVKLFEVQLDTVLGPVPASINDLSAYDLRNRTRHNGDAQPCEVVPVIFLRNEVLKYPGLDVGDLAQKMIHFVHQKLNSEDYPELRSKEIQVDCDWTESTAATYHQLILAMKNNFKGKISITLRLYPYKFRERMGIPPADRAVLMCYNLMAPSQSGTKNSILDVQLLHDYVDGVEQYPLPLDLVFPIYSMVFHYRNNLFFQTLQWDPTKSQLPLDSLGNGVYRIQENALENDFLFRKGDIIEVETVSNALLDEAVRIVHEEVELQDSATISFYHLSKENISAHGIPHLAAIYKFWH
jgi:hypothetical protein